MPDPNLIANLKSTFGESPKAVKPLAPDKPGADFFNSLLAADVDNPSITPERRIDTFLAGKAARQQPWSAVEPEFKQKFGEAAPDLGPHYELQKQKAYYSEKEPNLIEYGLLRSTPVVSSLGTFGMAKDYKAARERMAAGKSEPDDAKTIARYERLQELEAKQQETTGGAARSSLAHIPAMLGEALLTEGVGSEVKGLVGAKRLGRAAKAGEGGEALEGLGLRNIPAAEAAPATARYTATDYAAATSGRVAGTKETAGFVGGKVGGNLAQTAAMPSMYLPQSAERAIEKGGDWSDVDNLGRSYAIANLQVAVLGRLGPAGDAIPAGGPVAFGTRLGVRTGTGMIEQQAADSIAQAVGLQEKKGTLYDAVNSEPGSLKNATTEAITFAAFSLMHGAPQKKGLKPKPLEIDPARAQQAVAPVVETIDALKAQGQTPQQIGDTMQGVHQKIDAALVADPTLTKDQARKLFENEPPEIQKYAEVKIGTLPDKKVPIQDSSLAPREAVLKELGRQKGNEALLKITEEMTSEEGNAQQQREHAKQVAAKLPEGNLKRYAEQLVERAFGKEPAKAPVGPVKPSSEWTDPNAVVEPSDHAQAFDKLSPAVQGELAQTHGVPVEAFRSGADPAYRQTLRKHLEQTARPTVLKDVFDKVKAQDDFIEQLPGGDSLGTFRHGDRYVQVFHSKKDNFVRIDFDYVDHDAGVRTAVTEGPLQSGTKALGDKIKSMVDEFHKRGLMITYAASEATAGRGGSRTRLYAKLLERAGYKLTDTIDHPDGAKDYLWEPGEKPSRVGLRPSPPEIAPEAPKPADLPPQEPATPPKPEPASVVPEQKPVVPAGDVPSKANTLSRRVDKKENVGQLIEEVKAATEKGRTLLAAFEQAGLTARERSVLEQRALGGRTLEAVGKDLGVSKERARQVEADALNKLKTIATEPEAIASVKKMIHDANKAEARADATATGDIAVREGMTFSKDDAPAVKKSKQEERDKAEKQADKLLDLLLKDKVTREEYEREYAKLFGIDLASDVPVARGKAGTEKAAPVVQGEADRGNEQVSQGKGAEAEAPAPTVAERRSEPFRTPKDQFPTPDPRLKGIAKRAGDGGRLRTRASWHGQQPELEYVDKSGKYKILLTTKPDGFVDLDFNKVDAVGGRDQAKSLGAPATQEGVSVVREVRELARELHGKGVPLEYATSDTINAAKAGEASRHDWYSKFLPRVGYREATPPGGIDMGDGVRVFRWEPAEKSGFLSDRVQGNLFGRGTRAPLPAKKGSTGSLVTGEMEAKANAEAQQARMEEMARVSKVADEDVKIGEEVKEAERRIADFEKANAKRKPGESLLLAIKELGGIRADSLNEHFGGEKTKKALTKENDVWSFPGLVHGKPIKKGLRQKGVTLEAMAQRLAEEGHIPGGTGDPKAHLSAAGQEDTRGHLTDILVDRVQKGMESGNLKQEHYDERHQVNADREFVEKMADPAERKREAESRVDKEATSFDFGHNLDIFGRPSGAIEDARSLLGDRQREGKLRLPISLTSLSGLKDFSWKKAFRRWVVSGGDLVHREIFEAKLRSNNHFNAYLTDVKNWTKDVMAAAKEYKQKGGYNRIDDAEVKLMNLALQNNVMAKLQVRQMSPKLADLIEQGRLYKKGLSNELVQMGAARGELAVTIDANGDVYLNRAYQVFTDPKWYEKVPQDVKDRAMAWWDGEQKKLGVNLSQPELEDWSKKMLKNDTAADNVISFLASKQLGAKDLGIFKERKDVPKELRELWGEIEDPIANLTNTIYKQARMLSDHAFQTEILKAGMGKFFFPKEVTTPDGTEHIYTLGSNFTHPDTGPLGGLINVHMSKELKHAFETAYTPQQMSKFGKFYMKMTGITKYAKTVGNFPVGYIKNLLGNVGPIVRNGHWRIGHALESMKPFLRDTPETRDKFRRLTELGVIGDGVREHDFRRDVQEVLAGKEDDMANRINQITDRQIVRAFKAGLRIPAKVYRLMDTIPKVYAFYNELADYKSVDPSKPLAQQEQEAADRVRKTYPSNSMAPKIVDVARRNPFAAPFPTFTAETIRNHIATLKLAVKELSRPETRHIGAKRLTGYLLSAGLTAGIGALSRAISGVTSDEDEAMRRNMPPWSKHSVIVHFGKGADGKPLYMDIGSTDPDAYFFKIAHAALHNEPGGAAKEAAGPFALDPEILTTKLGEVAFNHDLQNDRPIRNTQAPAGDQAEKIGRHVGEAFKPGSVDTVQRLLKTEHPERELTQIGGQRVQEIDTSKSMFFKGKDYSNARSEAHRIVNSAIKAQGPISDGSLAKEYQKTEAARRRLFDEMRQDVAAARLLKMDDKAITKVLGDAGMSQDDIRRIKNGEYKPYSPEHDPKDSPEVRRRKELVRGLARP